MRRICGWWMVLWLLAMVPSCGDDDAADGGGKAGAGGAAGDAGAIDGSDDTGNDTGSTDDSGSTTRQLSHIQGILFSRQLDGTQSKLSTQADGLATDADGNLYVTGFECANVTCQNALNERSSRIFVKKFSPSGDPIWVTEFTGMIDAEPGTNNAFDLAVSSAPYIYVNGAFQGEMTYVDSQGQSQTISSFEGDAGPSPDCFVAKVATADGSIEWLERFGGSRDDGGNELEVDLSGNVVLTLTTNSDSIDIGGTTYDRNTLGDSADLKPYDSLVVKMAPDGSVSWVTHFNGFGSERLRAIETDGAGNVYAGLEFIRELKVGSTSYDTGHVQLSGGAFFRLAANDGSVTLAQRLFENDIFGPEHVSYLADYVEYNVRGIYADGSQNVFVCGVLSNELDIGKSATGETLTVNAGDPSAEFRRADFVAMYNQAGEVLWTDVIEREIGADGCEIDGDYGKNFALVGSYQGAYRIKRYDASNPTGTYVTANKPGNTDSERYYLLKYSAEASSSSTPDDYTITDVSFLEVGGSALPSAQHFKEGGTIYYNPGDQSITIGARLMKDSEVTFGDLSDGELYSNPYTVEQGLVAVHSFD